MLRRDPVSPVAPSLPLKIRPRNGFLPPTRGESDVAARRRRIRSARTASRCAANDVPLVVRDPKMNLGKIEHAMFDRAHLTPAVARVRSRFTPPAVKSVNTPYRISDGNLRMPASKRRSLFQGGAVLLHLLWAMSSAPEDRKSV